MPIAEAGAVLTEGTAVVEGVETVKQVEALQVVEAQEALEVATNSTEATRVYEAIQVNSVEGASSFQEVKSVETINDHLEGTNHPETDVPFRDQQVELPNGETVEGVFPDFEEVYSVELSEDMYEASDREHFSYANEELAEAMSHDEQLAEQFTETEKEMIREGETPDGYTWHHHEQTGRLELVDEKIHAQTGHTGGRFLWGGGTVNR